MPPQPLFHMLLTLSWRRPPRTQTQSPLPFMSKFLCWFELRSGWEQDWGASLSLWLVSAAKFISSALETSILVDLRLSLLKFASRRLGVAWWASSYVCVSWEVCLTPPLVDIDSKWLNPPWWLIERGNELLDNPALCELLNEDVASLEGWNFRNKSCVTCS